MNNEAIANYHEYKISVRSIADGPFSFNLACYCVTPLMPKDIEPCPIRVTVNFYKFKAWIIERDWIVNFEEWLFKYGKTAYFYECLTAYINELQGRTKVYLPPSPVTAQLDSLIAQAKNITALYQSLV